jgi:ribosomal protein S12 methylthiotransferase accessory factor
MTVTIIGSGPAVSSVERALTDTDHEHEVRSASSPSPDALTGTDELAIVVGRVGSDVFSTMNASMRETGLSWLAVELGGVGGHAVPSVEAAVSGFGPETGCFECLRKRVAATLDTEGDNETDTSTDRFAGALAGRESVRVLSESESASPVLGGVIEIPHAIRRVLPVPNCECVEKRDWTLRREHEERTLDEALRRAEEGLDDRVGLIHETGEFESFPVPYYLARLSDTSGFSDVMGSRQAAGVALGWDEAFMKALGEGLERYSAGVYRTADLRTARPTDLPNSLAPSAFVRPATDASNNRITWVPGENLSTDNSVFLPASRVFFPYDTSEPTITTGLGLGSSGATAIIAGLTEIIERDAALLAWYSTYEPLGLSIDDEEYDTLVGRAGVDGLSVTATLLTQDIDVPVVGVSVHRDNGEWPAFAMGLAADLDPVDAARTACCEALQNWMELRGMGQAEAATAGGRIGHFASRPSSIEEFVSPETTIPASSIADDVPAGPDALDALVQRVTDADLDVYAARLTPPDVDALGFEAVRVLVPRAQPLFVDDPYFGERAERVPEQLGFESRLRREHHPYP